MSTAESNAFSNNENPQPEQNESIESEKMVEVIKIKTIFADQKVLEKIADRLLDSGLISGFSIEPVIGGYVYNGKKVEEEQFSLEIMVEASIEESLKEKIISEIRNTISEKWDVPDIIEERVSVNEKLLGFIQRAEVEHTRYVMEKKWRRAASIAALLSISSAVGLVSKKYIDDTRTAAHKEEISRQAKDLSELHQKIQEQIKEIEDKIQFDQTEPYSGLHPNEGSEMAFGGFKETRDILNVLRESQQKLDQMSK